MNGRRPASLLTALALLAACQQSDSSAGGNEPQANAARDGAQIAAAAPDAALAGTTRIGSAAQPELWVAEPQVWPVGPNGSTRPIPVCWEQGGSAREKAWVQDAIEQSWDLVSLADFTGWGDCAADSRGIRIAVEDSGAFTRGLGTRLNGVANGMHLNFTMERWNRGCVQRSGLEACIRMVAIHEFGHALAFAHEQNRPDTPGECEERQGSDGTRILTPWDEHSVMNYCNPVYSNGGRLSEHDVAGAQEVYGAAM
jgi:hypothetical protein